MELGPSLAPELATAVDPLSRGPPEVARPPGKPPDADSAVAPFELLLQMLGNRLPHPLPGGETLPAGAAALTAAGPGAPGSAAPLVPLDPTAQGAAVPGLIPLPPPSAATVAGGVTDAAPAAPPGTALAEALRVALAAAPTAQGAGAPTVSAAADSTSAAAAGATGTDAPAAAPSSTPGAAPPPATPVDLDALLALAPGARASAPPPVAEPFAQRPRAAADSRTRASGATPAARALGAADLLRADAAAMPRSDAAPRTFELHPAPIALATAQLDDALSANLTAPAPSGDATAAGTSTAFASLVSQPGSTSSAAAQPSAQLPAHLGTPVDTSAARWDDALASRIHWLVDHEVGEARLKLSPPELGALDVKISMLDDKTYVQMTAHTSAARDELSQSLPRLRELLSAGGLDLGGATVSGGRDDRSGYQAAAQPVQRALGFAAVPAELGADLPRLRLASESRIDTFA